MQQVEDKEAADPQGEQQSTRQADKKMPLQPDTTVQDLQATTKKRQKLADELQTVEKQVSSFAIKRPREC